MDPTFVFNEVSWTHSELRVLADGSLFGGGTFFNRDGSHRETIPRLMNSGLAAEWPDGSLLMSNWTESGDGVEYLRWIPGAGRDPDFACPLRPDSRVRRFLPLPDGGLILAGHLVLPNGTNSLVKFYPDGRPDPAFRPPPAYRILPRPPGLQFLINGEDIFPAFAGHRARPADISSMRLQPGGAAVLVGGNFTHLGFSPRQGLALLSLETPRDYQEWMASTMGDTSFSPFEDEDHDGRTNLEEYATGSDPGRPDRSPTVRLSASAPPIFQIPLNPQALGVRIIPQISNDLTGWTDAEDTQFAATSLPHLLRLQSTSSPSQLFLRLRFEQETAPR